MFVNHTESYTLPKNINIIIKKAIAAILAVAFLFNDIAYATNYQNLAPESRMLRKDFKAVAENSYAAYAGKAAFEYICRSLISQSSHRNIGDIKEREVVVFRKGPKKDPADFAKDSRRSTVTIVSQFAGKVSKEMLIVSIPELLKNTGRAGFSDLEGIGGVPIVYMDSAPDIYYDQKAIEEASLRRLEDDGKDIDKLYDEYAKRDQPKNPPETKPADNKKLTPADNALWNELDSVGSGIKELTGKWDDTGITKKASILDRLSIALGNLKGRKPAYNADVFLNSWVNYSEKMHILTARLAAGYANRAGIIAGCTGAVCTPWFAGSDNIIGWAAFGFIAGYINIFLFSYVYTYLTEHAPGAKSGFRIADTVLGRMGYKRWYRPPQLTYYLNVIAHGLTPNNAKKIMHGCHNNGPDSELSEEGREQARLGAMQWWEDNGADFMLSAKARENYVFRVSPLKRAEETYEIYRRYIKEMSGGIDIGDAKDKKDFAVREMDFGVWERDVVGNFSSEEQQAIGEFLDGNVLIVPENGESMGKFMWRVRDWTEGQNEKLRGKKVFVFGHGLWKSTASIILKRPNVVIKDGCIDWLATYHSEASDRGRAILMNPPDVPDAKKPAMGPMMIAMAVVPWMRSLFGNAIRFAHPHDIGTGSMASNYISFETQFGPASEETLKFVTGELDLSKIEDFHRMWLHTSEHIEGRKRYVSQWELKIGGTTYRFFTQYYGSNNKLFEGDYRIRLQDEAYMAGLAQEAGVGSRSTLIKTSNGPEMLYMPVPGEPAGRIDDLEMVKAMGNALGRLHAKGVYHGDITDDKEFEFRDNLFIDKTVKGYRAYVIDFEFSDLNSQSLFPREKYSLREAIRKRWAGKNEEWAAIIPSFEEGYNEGLAPSMEGNLIGKLYSSPDLKPEHLVTNGIEGRLIKRSGGVFLSFGYREAPKGELRPLYSELTKPIQGRTYSRAQIKVKGRVPGTNVYILRDRRDIQGFANGEYQFISEALINDKSARDSLERFHEEREQYWAKNKKRLPEGVNSHTKVRGVGKDIRDALRDKEKTVKGYGAKKLIRYIAKLDKKRDLTSAELSLIWHNNSRGKKGVELVYGEQDEKFGAIVNESRERKTIMWDLYEIIFGKSLTSYEGLEKWIMSEKTMPLPSSKSANGNARKLTNTLEDRIERVFGSLKNFERHYGFPPSRFVGDSSLMHWRNVCRFILSAIFIDEGKPRKPTEEELDDFMDPNKNAVVNASRTAPSQRSLAAAGIRTDSFYWAMRRYHSGNNGDEEVVVADDETITNRIFERLHLKPIRRTGSRSLSKRENLDRAVYIAMHHKEPTPEEMAAFFRPQPRSTPPPTNIMLGRAIGHAMENPDIGGIEAYFKDLGYVYDTLTKYPGTVLKLLYKDLNGRLPDNRELYDFAIQRNRGIRLSEKNVSRETYNAVWMKQNISYGACENYGGLAGVAEWLGFRSFRKAKHSAMEFWPVYCWELYIFLHHKLPSPEELDKFMDPKVSKTEIFPDGAALKAAGRDDIIEATKLFGGKSKVMDMMGFGSVEKPVPTPYKDITEIMRALNKFCYQYGYLNMWNNLPEEVTYAVKTYHGDISNVKKQYILVMAKVNPDNFLTAVRDVIEKKAFDDLLVFVGLNGSIRDALTKARRPDVLKAYAAMIRPHKDALEAEAKLFNVRSLIESATNGKVGMDADDAGSIRRSRAMAELEDLARARREDAGRVLKQLIVDPDSRDLMERFFATTIGTRIAHMVGVNPVLPNSIIAEDNFVLVHAREEAETSAAAEKAEGSEASVAYPFIEDVAAIPPGDRLAELNREEYELLLQAAPDPIKDLLNAKDLREAVRIIKRWIKLAGSGDVDFRTRDTPTRDLTRVRSKKGVREFFGDRFIEASERPHPNMPLLFDGVMLLYNEVPFFFDLINYAIDSVHYSPSSKNSATVIGGMVDYNDDGLRHFRKGGPATFAYFLTHEAAHIILGQFAFCGHFAWGAVTEAVANKLCSLLADSVGDKYLQKLSKMANEREPSDWEHWGIESNQETVYSWYGFDWLPPETAKRIQEIRRERAALTNMPKMMPGAAASTLLAYPMDVAGADMEADLTKLILDIESNGDIARKFKAASELIYMLTGNSDIAQEQAEGVSVRLLDLLKKDDDRVKQYAMYVLNTLFRRHHPISVSTRERIIAELEKISKSQDESLALYAKELLCLLGRLVIVCGKEFMVTSGLIAELAWNRGHENLIAVPKAGAFVTDNLRHWDAAEYKSLTGINIGSGGAGFSNTLRFGSAVNHRVTDLDMAFTEPSPILNGAFIHGDAERMPVTSERMDFAIMAFVLNYLPHPEKGAQEMLRVLRPGGRAFIVLHNPRSGYFKLEEEYQKLHPDGRSYEEKIAELVKMLIWLKTAMDTRGGSIKKLEPQLMQRMTNSNALYGLLDASDALIKERRSDLNKILRENYEHFSSVLQFHLLWASKDKVLKDPSAVEEFFKAAGFEIVERAQVIPDIVRRPTTFMEWIMEKKYGKTDELVDPECAFGVVLEKPRKAAMKNAPEAGRKLPAGIGGRGNEPFAPKHLFVQAEPFMEAGDTMALAMRGVELPRDPLHDMTRGARYYHNSTNDDASDASGLGNINDSGLMDQYNRLAASIIKFLLARGVYFKGDLEDVRQEIFLGFCRARADNSAID